MTDSRMLRVCERPLKCSVEFGEKKTEWDGKREYLIRAGGLDLAHFLRLWWGGGRWWWWWTVLSNNPTCVFQLATGESLTEMCEEWLCPYFHPLVMVSAGPPWWLRNSRGRPPLQIRPSLSLLAASLGCLRWVHRDARHICIGACIHQRAGLWF